MTKTAIFLLTSIPAFCLGYILASTLCSHPEAGGSGALHHAEAIGPLCERMPWRLSELRADRERLNGMTVQVKGSVFLDACGKAWLVDDQGTKELNEGVGRSIYALEMPTWPFPSSDRMVVYGECVVKGRFFRMKVNQQGKESLDGLSRIDSVSWDAKASKPQTPEHSHAPVP